MNAGQRVRALFRRGVRRLRDTRLARCLYLVTGLFREARLVWRGLRAQHRNDPQAVAYRLRRNIHRLEKALGTRNRRGRFALSYISRTVKDLGLLLKYRAEDRQRDADLSWAADVLREYFSVVEDGGIVAAAREEFMRQAREMGLASGGPVVRKEKEREAPGVSTDHLRQLVERRKSVRWFLPERIERGTIDQALEIARLAPSACNRQPLRFVVLDRPEEAAACAGLLMGAEGYAANVPAMVVIVGRMRAFEHPRDRHLVHVEAGLCAMLFLLALETLGLGGCCVNCPDLGAQSRRLSRFLTLERDEQPVLAVVFGKPDPEGLVGRADRRPLEKLRQYYRS